MFEMLVSSATAGFGASFGRDLYRAAKKNPVIMGIVGALLLAFGWRNLFLGYGRSFAYFLFVNLIGSIIMILVGSVILSASIAVGVTMFFTKETAPVTLAVAGCLAFVSLVGILWGRKDRKARIRRQEIERLNLGFLVENGFEESEFESDQMRDSEGNTLKLIEQTDDRLVFSVVGRRGLRAAIKLVDGQMISYSGVKKAA